MRNLLLVIALIAPILSASAEDAATHRQTSDMAALQTGVSLVEAGGAYAVWSKLPAVQQAIELQQLEKVQPGLIKQYNSSEASKKFLGELDRDASTTFNKLNERLAWTGYGSSVGEREMLSTQRELARITRPETQAKELKTQRLWEAAQEKLKMPEFAPVSRRLKLLRASGPAAVVLLLSDAASRLVQALNGKNAGVFALDEPAVVTAKFVDKNLLQSGRSSPEIGALDSDQPKESSGGFGIGATEAK